MRQSIIVLAFFTFRLLAAGQQQDTTPQAMEQIILNSFKTKDSRPYLDLGCTVEEFYELYLYVKQVEEKNIPLSPKMKEALNDIFREEKQRKTERFNEIIHYGILWGIHWENIAYDTSEQSVIDSSYGSWLSGKIYFTHQDKRFSLTYKDFYKIGNSWKMPYVYLIQKEWDNLTYNHCLSQKGTYFKICTNKLAALMPLKSKENIAKVCACSFENIMTEPHNDCRELIRSGAVIDEGCMDPEE